MDTYNRNQTFRFGCSKSEKDQIDEMVSRSGQNKSDFMISLLLNDFKSKVLGAAIFTCRISDQVNQLEADHPEVNFTPLRREVDQLCRQLL